MTEKQHLPCPPGTLSQKLCTGSITVVFHVCVLFRAKDNLDFLDNWYGFTHRKEEMASCSWFWSGAQEALVHLRVRLEVEDSRVPPRWAELSHSTGRDSSSSDVRVVPELLGTHQAPLSWHFPGMEPAPVDDFAWVQSNISILVSSHLTPMVAGSKTRGWGSVLVPSCVWQGMGAVAAVVSWVVTRVGDAALTTAVPPLTGRLEECESNINWQRWDAASGRQISASCG